MRCYKCGVMVKETGAEYIPSHRLAIYGMHIKECKSRVLKNLDAFWTFLKVRELAGYNNKPYFEAMVDYLDKALHS